MQQTKYTVDIEQDGRGNARIVLSLIEAPREGARVLGVQRRFELCKGEYVSLIVMADGEVRFAGHHCNLFPSAVVT